MFLTRRFATFLVFGGLAAVVNLGVGRALYTLPSTSALLPYWVAVGLASAAGLLVNFSLNYAFNFGYRGRSAGAQLRTFVMVAMGGVALTALLASLVRALAAWSGVPAMLEVAGTTLSVEFLAHVIAVGLVTFYSFIGHSVLSFNAGLRAFLRHLPALNQFQRRAS
ncbi:MAG TPA: GtrA family protein [Vineibacter sp.]|nr:GtrA family protein [Vineibacter sp.]